MNSALSTFKMSIVAWGPEAEPISADGRRWASLHQELESLLVNQLHTAFGDRRFRGADPHHREVARRFQTDEILRHGYGRGKPLELERARSALVANICAFVSVDEAMGLELANGHIAVITLDRLCDDLRLLLGRAAEKVAVALKAIPVRSSAGSAGWPRVGARGS